MTFFLQIELLPDQQRPGVAIVHQQLYAQRAHEKITILLAPCFVEHCCAASIYYPAGLDNKCRLWTSGRHAGNWTANAQARHQSQLTDEQVQTEAHCQVLNQSRPGPDNK